MSPEPAVASITRHLNDVRRRIRRYRPHELVDALADGAVVVDIRPADLRATTGHIPQSVVIERNVLEWRLDPTSPWRIAQVGPPPPPIIIVCHEGYASSLAAAALQEVGLNEIGDLEGGIVGWIRAGLPVSAHPAGDHSAPGTRTDS